MKTPMQEFIDEINYKIDYLIQNKLEDERWRTVHYDVTIKVLGEIESILKGRYLEEEKHWIIGAYHFGWDDGANNYRPVSDVIYEDGEDFYNKTFNQ